MFRRACSIRSLAATSGPDGMARVAVVTSTPPNVEGGHMVIARALVTAITEAGHDAGLITTPSHPFGQQASEYVAN